MGLTEEQVKERGIPYVTGAFPFAGAGRARCLGEEDPGLRQGHRPQGNRPHPGRAHHRRPRSRDDRQAVLAIEFGASAEDIARTVHGHPTFAEALMEAAAAVAKELPPVRGVPGERGRFKTTRGHSTACNRRGGPGRLGGEPP